MRKLLILLVATGCYPVIEADERNGLARGRKCPADKVTAGGRDVLEILRLLGARRDVGATDKQLVSYAGHFDRSDADRDGRHSKKEYIEDGRFMTPQARRGIFGAADNNADGVVTRVEYVLNRIITDEAKGIVQRTDADKNGRIVKAEFVGGSPLKDGRLAAAVFDALDTNGDGTTTIPEYLRVWGGWARPDYKAQEAAVAARLAKLGKGESEPPTGGQGQEADVEALERLARSTGAEYVSARDKLLAAHPEPFDVERIAKRSWEAGLIAFLLESRRAHPHLYEEWDKTDLRKRPATRSGRPGVHPALSHQHGLPCCIELYYALGSTESARIAYGNLRSEADRRLYFLERTLSMLWRMQAQGPLPLWQAAWKNAPAQRRFVRLVAIRAIASDDSEASYRVARATFMKGGTDGEARRAILAGTEENPQAALRFLKETFSLWKERSSLVDSAALITLRRLPGEEPRRFLHRILLGADHPERLRKNAALECAWSFSEGELAVCQELVARGGEANLAVAVWGLTGGCADRSGVRDKKRPILRAVSRATSNSQTLARIADYFIGRGTPEDVQFAVRKLVGDERLSEFDRKKLRRGLEVRRRRDEEQE